VPLARTGVNRGSAGHHACVGEDRGEAGGREDTKSTAADDERHRHFHDGIRDEADHDGVGSSLNCCAFGHEVGHRHGQRVHVHETKERRGAVDAGLTEPLRRERHPEQDDLKDQGHLHGRAELQWIVVNTQRLANRGLIKEGQWADVTIFDLDALQDRATYDEPMLFPKGIDYVLVNGVVTIDHEKHTGAKAGKVLYGPGKN